jgi:UrcA family protein
MSVISASKFFSRITALGLAIVIVSSFASMPGFAADSVKVRVNANPEVTYKRLQGAAAALCGPATVMELARYAAWQRCYRTNLQHAVDQVNEPALLAIHHKAVESGAYGATHIFPG